MRGRGSNVADGLTFAGHSTLPECGLVHVALSPTVLQPPTHIQRRISFVIELARQLHQYGTSASRLEEAILQVAQSLGLRAEVWSSPTAIILSFYDPDAGDDALAYATQVMRLPPGDVNLERLRLADQIADQVIAGVVDVGEGWRMLRALNAPRSRRRLLAIALSYGLAASCVAVLLRTSLADMLAAGLIGVVIGLITVASFSRPRLGVAADAINGLVATSLAILIAAFVVPLAVKPVVLAALIVLMPGMALTTAVRELSSQHLVSGSARMAGALATLLKLSFGTLAATQLCALLGIVAEPVAWPPLPVWATYPALVVAALAIAVLFQAARRDWPVVVISVIAGYLISRVVGDQLNAAFGVFAAGLALSALSNVFARWARRPGALVREPGILLLVPGSVSFRSLSSMMERDLSSGMDTAVLLVTLLVALVAGLMFGDLLVPPRQRL